MMATTQPAIEPRTSRDGADGNGHWIRVGPRAELQGVAVVSGGRHGIAVFPSATSEAVYAVDNRCPHMGFPLHKGSVADGILTCHWHHARFDVATGGTFDTFADDVQTFGVQVVDGVIRPVQRQCELHVLAHQQFPEISRQLRVASREFADQRDHGFRDDLIRMSAARDPGDVAGERGHPGPRQAATVRPPR